EQGNHQGFEHASAPARDDLHAPVLVMRLEDGNAQVRAGFPLRNLFLKSPPGLSAAANAEVVIRRKLSSRNADIAGDAGLSVDHPIRVRVRPVVGPVAKM